MLYVVLSSIVTCLDMVLDQHVVLTCMGAGWLSIPASVVCDNTLSSIVTCLDMYLSDWLFLSHVTATSVGGVVCSPVCTWCTARDEARLSSTVERLRCSTHLSAFSGFVYWAPSHSMCVCVCVCVRVCVCVCACVRVCAAWVPECVTNVMVVSPVVSAAYTCTLIVFHYQCSSLLSCCRNCYENQ